MHYVYMLECSDGSLYTGSTRNLEQRIQEHATGAIHGHTARRLPVKLIWSHETERISDAYWLEHQIKGWRRDKKLALAEGRITDLPALARRSRSASARGGQSDPADSPPTVLSVSKGIPNFGGRHALRDDLR